jgi:hypothetical protein
MLPRLVVSIRLAGPLLSDNSGYFPLNDPEPIIALKPLSWTGRG